MDIRRITVAYFSPTGNVEKVVRCVAEGIQKVLASPELEFFDFLPPEVRGQAVEHTSGQSKEQAVQQPLEFGEGDLLVLGVPVYAGRVPNRILPFIQSGFKATEPEAGQTPAGQASPICIPIVCFGNRNYDDALAELAMEMRNSGFTVPAGAAIATEHSFCPEIGTGRPDEKDMVQINEFATKVGEYILAMNNEEHNDLRNSNGGALKNGVAVSKKSEGELLETNNVAGMSRDIMMPGNTPPGPYYTPLKEDGTPANFLKTAIPVTDTEKCDRCMKCVRRCPMGSIDKTDPAAIKGICIKCHSCVSVCSKNAKTFTDEEFLSHKRALASNYVRRAESVFIIP